MKIQLAIATYNRKETVKIFSLVLKKYLPVDINVKIYDDKSSEYDEEFLKEIFPFATNIKINLENFKADKNMYQIYQNFLNAEEDILIQLDSDMIISREFFDIVFKIIDEMKKQEAVYSLYNSDNHKFLKNEKKNIAGINFQRKESLGGACVIFSKKTIEKILKNIQIIENDFSNFDWRWSEYLIQNNIPIYVSVNSYVQHIGYGGQNNFNVDNLDFGNNFVSSLDLEIIQFMLEYYEKIFILQKKRILELKENYNNTFVAYRIKSFLKKNKYFIKNYKKMKNIIKKYKIKI